MPSMLTHRVLGDDTVRRIDPNREVIRAIDAEFELYSIGTSGPDIFFFYQAMPWGDKKNAPRVSNYGSLMHDEKTDLVFRTMINQCRKTMDKAQISYTAGVMIHWALDHIAHPYVFNRTGIGGASGDSHRYFESQLDRGVCDWKKIDITKFKPYSVTAYKPDTWYPIWQLYDEVLRNGWNIELHTVEAQQMVKDFDQIEHFLYDPKGIRMKAVLKLEEKLGKTGMMTSMIIPRHLDPDWNVMNEDHQLWHHPMTGEEHHESFIELFEQATDCAEELLNTFSGYLEGTNTEDEVMNLFTGNFCTGLKVPNDMKIFDLVPTLFPRHLTDK